MPVRFTISLGSILVAASCGGATVGAGTSASDTTTIDAGSTSTSAAPTADATVTPAADHATETVSPEFLPKSDLRPEELARFGDFAIHSLGNSFEDLPLVFIIREKGSYLLLDIDPSSRVNLDRVMLAYGTCDAGASGRCAAPLAVEISPACRVNPTTYDGPHDRAPLRRTTIRGAPADDFGDSVIIYSGDVAIKLHAEPKLAARAAAALAPANDLARAAIATARTPGELPQPAPGALDGTIAC
jgi:hypothetical protein